MSGDTVGNLSLDTERREACSHVTGLSGVVEQADLAHTIFQKRVSHSSLPGTYVMSRA